MPLERGRTRWPPTSRHVFLPQFICAIIPPVRTRSSGITPQGVEVGFVSDVTPSRTRFSTSGLSTTQRPRECRNREHSQDRVGVVKPSLERRPHRSNPRLIV